MVRHSFRFYFHGSVPHLACGDSPPPLAACAGSGKNGRTVQGLDEFLADQVIGARILPRDQLPILDHVRLEIGLCRKIAFSRHNPKIVYWKIKDLRVHTFLFSVICDRAIPLP